MKTIQIGNRYEIYDDTLQTFDQLPVKTYVVRFAKMAGFFLEAHNNLDVGEKVYGIHSVKADKVLRSFTQFNRNLGVILSGDKGIGKSIFARILSERAVQQGIPVIIVDRFIPGIASYIESIEQEVLVLFDEFDKTFGNIKTDENEPDPQAGLLSLFDGVAQGKKLFVVTCNELRGLNDYLVNRPGRFHYHFRFSYPSDTEIREYLMDKLDEKYQKEIENVIYFSKKVDLNYDCLRSIAFELNSGLTFSEAISDLNIINMRDIAYDLVLHMEDGSMHVSKGYRMDMFGSVDKESVWMRDNNGAEIVRVSFDPTASVYDMNRGCSTIEADQLAISFDECEDEAKVTAAKKLRPLYLSITRSRGKEYHYAA